VREEGVFLEDQSDRAALGPEEDPRGGVEPDLRVGCDATPLGPQQPRDRSEDTRLPGARRPDERERPAPDVEL
jgi:hypothetical protein